MKILCALFGHRKWLFYHGLFSRKRPQSDWLRYRNCPRCGIALP